MAIEQFIRLAARLFAVWLVLAQGIHLAVIFFTPDSIGNGVQLPRTGYAVGLALTVILSASLWFFPEAIAKGIISKKDIGKKVTASISLEDMQALCFSVMGLWFAATALFYLAGFPHNVIDLFRASSQEPSFGMALHIVVPKLLQLVVGIWLFVGGRGFGGFVNWLRNMPRKSPLE